MKTLDDLYNLIKAWIEQHGVDACQGCAFWEREAWEPPCNECKRSKRDFWRRAEE